MQKVPFSPRLMVFSSQTMAFVLAHGTLWGTMKAEVTDNNGQKYSVETILGANELYDVAKFKITAKN